MQIVLGPSLGHTTAASCRIWIHTDEASTEPIACHVYLDADRTQSIPGSPFFLNTDTSTQLCAVVNIPLPCSDHTYYYCFKYQGRLLGERSYQFHNLPAHPHKLVFAVISCHNPFRYQWRERMAMWDRLYEVMDKREAHFVIHTGDQIYADYPASYFFPRNAWDKAMLLNEHASDTPERIRKLYRDCYRQYWDFPQRRALAARFPQYLIWDDHEITDGWGSQEQHQHFKQRQIFTGAMDVYKHFQHSHNPSNTLHPHAFYYGYHHAHCSFLTLDLRGQRRIWDKHLLGDAQRVWIRQFLAECRNTRHLFLISPVPLFHLKGLLANLPVMSEISDIRDQWSHDINLPDRLWLLNTLIDWMQQQPLRQVYILGGDVHVGTLGTATLSNDPSCKLFLATSSPISNKPAGLLDQVVRKWSADFKLPISSTRSLKVDLAARFTRRNFLLVSVEDRAQSSDITLEMFEEGRSSPSAIRHTLQSRFV